MYTTQYLNTSQLDWILKFKGTLMHNHLIIKAINYL